MANYFFLAPSLPPLVIGQKPDIQFDELSERLKINLTREDFAKTVVVRRYIDLRNLRALMMKKPLDHRGNLSEKELEDVLIGHGEMPEYVNDYFEKYESVEERLRNFSELVAAYFVNEMQKADGFLKEYLSMERDFRLVLLGLRSKRIGADVAAELQFEDLSDPMVASLLAQKDSAQYEPPIEYLEIKEIFNKPNLNPLQRSQLFLEYKFRKIDELIKRPLFSIDWILSYIIELIFIEHWNMLSEEAGLQIFDGFAVI